MKIVIPICSKYCDILQFLDFPEISVLWVCSNLLLHKYFCCSRSVAKPPNPKGCFAHRNLKVASLLLKCPFMGHVIETETKQRAKWVITKKTLLPRCAKFRAFVRPSVHPSARVFFNPSAFFNVRPCFFQCPSVRFH